MSDVSHETSILVNALTDAFTKFRFYKVFQAFLHKIESLRIFLIMNNNEAIK